MKIIKIQLLNLIFILFLFSCSNPSYFFGKKDTQVILDTKLGSMIDVVPVKIRGNAEVGAIIA